MATSDQIQGELELGYQHTLVSARRIVYSVGFFIESLSVNSTSPGYCVLCKSRRQCHSINKSTLRLFQKQFDLNALFFQVFIVLESPCCVSIANAEIAKRVTLHVAM